MNKSEFLKKLAEKNNVHSKETNKNEKFFNNFLETLVESLQELNENSKLTLTGFGTFSVKHKSARQGKNPRTGKTIDIPAKKVINFKFSKSFKDTFAA